MSKSARTVGIVAGVAAIGLLSAYAFAQQGPDGDRGRMGMGPGMMKGMGTGGMGHGGMGHGPRMGDTASRLSALRTELGIKPEQTAAWDTYVQIVTATATERREHAQHIDREAMRNLQPAERQQHISAMQTQRDAAQAKVKAAAEALVAKLDENQKAKASTALPGLAAAGPGMRFGMMGGQGAGRGDGHRMGPPWAR